MPRVLLLIIVIASLGARLVHIDAPPLGHHQWRQCDTSAMARAYARDETSFWRPVVDWRGSTSGVVESEFPLYPWVAGQLERAIYGAPARDSAIRHRIPRMLSLVGSMLTLVLAWDLVRLRSGRTVADWTAAVMAMLPLFMFYGRSIQPEAWMNATFVGSVWALARWSTAAEGGRFAWFVGSACAAALAILLKLPSLVIGLPLAVLMIERFGKGALSARSLVMAAAYGVIAILPAALWYAHASRLGEESGLSFGILASNKWGEPSSLGTWAFYRNVVLGKICEDHLAVAGAPLVALGLIMRRREKAERVFDAWTLAMVVHIALIPIGHSVHDYYQLPLTVPMAFYAGRFLARARFRERPALALAVRAAAAVALACGSAYTLARLLAKERSPGSAAETVLAREITRQAGVDELVAILVAEGHAGDPVVLYIADRKGWTLTPAAIADGGLEHVREQGAALFAMSRALVGDDRHYEAAGARTGLGRSIAGDALPDVALFRLEHVP